MIDSYTEASQLNSDFYHLSFECIC